MNDKFLSLLGIAKRAGQVSFGHDAVKDAVNSEKAKLIIFTFDSSERLKDEFRQKLENKDAKIIFSDYSMTDIFSATGSKAAVICVNENGFAKRLCELFNEKHKEV